jgi:NADPH:quinone reductase-like Zn-dependent oxidoreductase
VKVLIHDRFGPPETVLALRDLPTPPLKPHEVSIRVEAAPLHIGDLKNIAGEKLMVRHVKTGESLDVPLPQVPGIEGIGHVSGVGAEVVDFKIGDRVLLPLQCGAWREEVVADSRKLWCAPAGDAVQLSLIVNALTADIALRDLAPLQPGDWFVQNAANSNVGRILIKLARLRGIRTANIVRRDELVPELLALGADVVLRDGPDLRDRLRAATGGAPLRIGLDSIAGAATGVLAECLSDCATVANVGQMSGEPCQIPTWILLYKRTRIVGYYAGYNFAARTPGEMHDLVDGLTALIADGTLVTKIAATYPLEDYRQAVRHAALSGHDRDGKVVFVMRS